MLVACHNPTEKPTKLCLFTTLVPCYMCTGMIMDFGIPAENVYSLENDNTDAGPQKKFPENLFEDMKKFRVTLKGANVVSGDAGYKRSSGKFVFRSDALKWAFYLGCGKDIAERAASTPENLLIRLHILQGIFEGVLKDMSLCKVIASHARKIFKPDIGLSGLEDIEAVKQLVYALKKRVREKIHEDLKFTECPRQGLSELFQVALGALGWGIVVASYVIWKGRNQ